MQKWQLPGQTYTETYTYNTKNGSLTKPETSKGTISFDYSDPLLRLSKRTAGPIIENYSYVPGGNGANTTSTKIAQIAYTGVTQYFTNTTLSYTYDALGNIETVTKDGVTTTYTYDKQNQLTQEQTKNGNTVTSTSTYTYDTYGNIREKKVYSGAVTSANLEKTYTYSYPTTGWLDQLTGIKIDNGTTQSFTYDDIGNPLTYKNGTNWTFTWKNGRQLATANASGKNISYTYDVDGYRDSKTVNGVVHNYATLNGQVVRETWTENGKTNTLDILTDNNSKPYALVYNDGTATNTYYYVLNQQGDVIRLVDGNGATVASYTYNAWGEILSVKGPNGTVGASHIANINPIRYRGYYYDTETGFYYVGGRYYDPMLCRFVNADSAELLATGQGGITDKNLFAYCDNNPVMRQDDDGEFWNFVAGAFAGAAVNAIMTVLECHERGDSKGQIIAQATVSALTGAVGGLVAASGAGVAAQAVVGAVTAAIESGTNQSISNGGEIDGRQLIRETTAGAIGGIIGGKGAVAGDKKFAKPFNKSVKCVKKEINIRNVGKAIRNVYKHTRKLSKAYVIPTLKGIAKAWGGSRYVKRVRFVWK